MYGYTGHMRTQRYGTLSSRIYRWLIDPLLARLRPRIAHLCTRYGVTLMLDIGTATGAQCRTLHTAGIRAVGLDLSKAMVAAAKACSSEDIEYIVGSAYEMPFADGSFDGALLSLALHEHSEEERTRMLVEALRVVEPDGHLVIAEYSEQARTWLHIPWLVIRVIENLAGPEHRAGFRQFMATDGLRGLLQRHGLQPVEIVHSHFHTLTIAVIPAIQVLESATQSEDAQKRLHDSSVKNSAYKAGHLRTVPSPITGLTALAPSFALHDTECTCGSSP